MKIILIISLFCFLFLSIIPKKCSLDKKASTEQGMDTIKTRETDESALSTYKNPVAIFENDVKPILQKRCTPCHFEGGKMFDRMPFDEPETIINHQSGILKRIKDEEEAAAIRKFLNAELE